MLHGRKPRRSATSLVESAVVMNLTILLVMGVVIVGRGVFFYNQAANLARIGARYASVHAGQYMTDNAKAIADGTMPNVTESYLTTNVIKAAANGLDLSKLSVQVSINLPGGTYAWDDTKDNNNRALTSSVTQGSSTISVSNTVSVKVTYQWFPEMFLVGPFNLTSTSVQPLSY